MKNKITAIVFCIVLIGGTVLNIWGNIIHTSSEFSDSEFSLPLVGEIFDYIKENESQNIRGKTSLAFFSTAVQGYMGKKYIYDPGEDVVKLNNGHLAYSMVTLTDDESTYVKDYKKYFDILSEFNKCLAKSEIGLLYVQVPSRIPKENQYSPYKAIDCYNAAAETFLEHFDGSIDCLSVSDEIQKANLDYYDLFYKTDHHWNVDCGFFVSQKIKEYLDYTTDENVCDPNAYTKKTVKDCFLGSIGRRVGTMYCGREDFSVLYPSFETNLTVSVEGQDPRKGSFENTVIYNENLPTADSVTALGAYYSFCGGDMGLQIITNNNSINDKKILLIRNSHGGVVSPYLSLICKELHIIDLRHYSGISVLEYAKQMGADDVVVLYSQGSINDTCFNFFSDVKK